MEGWLVLALIFWLITSISKKKKQAEQANKRRAEEGQAPSSPAAAAGRQAPKRTSAPRAPGAMPDAAFSDARPEQRGPAQAKASGRPAPAPRSARVKAAEGTTLTRPETRLTKPVATERHELEASQLTGHAHEETSMTGFADECEPAGKPKRASLTVQAETAASPVPRLTVDDLRRAVVLSEILGKPKALRRRTNG